MKFELVSRRLKEALNDKHMTCADLARETGISEGSLSQYVNGIHSPSKESALKMSSVLNVNSAWLMGLDADKHCIANSVKQDFFLENFNSLSEENQKLVMQIIIALQKK